MQATLVKTKHISSENIFASKQNLFLFFKECQEESIRKSQRQIASISSETSLIDPLSIFEIIYKSDKKCFYFERIDRNEVIAGVGTALTFNAQGINRFSKIKQFIQSSLSNIISVGDLHLPFTGPHFFGNFTFFDNNIEPDFPFSQATVFLPRWQMACYQGKFVAVANIGVDSETDIDFLSEKIWHTYQRAHFFNCASSIELKNQACLLKERELNIINSGGFKEAVQSALQAIKANEFKKIVLAHAVDVISSGPLDPLHSLDKLRVKYPNSYIFCTSNGKGHSFLGASPERLIRVKDGELATEALAGSTPRGKTATEDMELANLLLSSQKDTYEHRIVIESIAARLLKFGIKAEIPPHPAILKLPNIQHLHTPIKAKMPNDLHILDLLAKLHPTPAVGGQPKDITCDKIRNYENFERGLYASPIGWIDYQGNGEFAVAIRSALLGRYHARLFAGAGIVADSDPNKESEEVNLKLQVLMDALV
ncbi:MAG: isochorismate synthase [Calothrix sp. MO_192.B10]|nr:isochorismate synthase [Calothrix sp. MO_192.B10]